MYTVAERRIWSSSWDVMDDLSAIPQENIIDYLLDRFLRGQIYTWIGTLLLAINPIGEIRTEDIYDLSQIDKYDNVCDVTQAEIAPHIFAVAARAHHRIIQGLGKSSQVIVLNGETGTGKTFNAWKALEFLIARNLSYDIQAQDTTRGIVQKITDACRLISAFTTAPTEKNEASSRHVQLVWLEYKMGKICGAMISSYLLERDRVTKGRCNFQIFGQMINALEDVEFADTGLSRNARYFISSDLDSRERQQFCDDFQSTLKIMDMLGFTNDQKKDIFQALSLIIHMGNIRFVEEDDRCKVDVDDQQSKEAFENTCKLTCLGKEDIAELLTSTLISPQSSSLRRLAACRRNLNTNDACRNRLHSIIRHLYDLIFRWLINSINKVLSVRLFSERLGILDIFGFECFRANGIEQLCVNYVNERLQQYFVEKYLESCRKDLQREGLMDDEEPSDVVRSYEDRINTIEKNLFAIINDVCLSTIPSDMFTLIRQVYVKNCPETRRFLKVRDESFMIQHYAGAVQYSVSDVFSKNIDKIPDEIVVTFSVSKNKFLYSLINQNQLHQSGRMKNHTMLSKVRYNVDLLTRELDKCDMHYVRCLKPQRLDNHEWNREDFWKQLTNTGILDALPLARCKFPIHFTYEEFVIRYCARYIAMLDLRIACKKILESFCSTIHDDDSSSVHYGKRLIFLTESTFLQLESARRQHRIECVRKIESFWIKYRNHRRQSMKENIVYCNIQALINAIVQDTFNEIPQTEYKNIARIIDNSTVEEKDQWESSYASDYKTAYIINWLDNVNKAMNIRNIESPISKRLRIDHGRDQSIDINSDINVQSITLLTAWRSSLNSNVLHMQKKYEMNFGNHSKDREIKKEDDVYVIRDGNFTLFFKNGVLNRRRPTKLPIKVHTRLTCLTNSHYLAHMELPQGLQDCL